MKIRLVLFFFFFNGVLYCQVKLLSWNLQNFGKSKSDSDIIFIANTIRNYDAVAIVEVVSGKGGAQAVARLAVELNRLGAKWDYVISDPASGNGTSERYAFLWKLHRLKKVGDAWLEKKYANEMEREPYFVTFEFEKKRFTIAVFHAVPKKKQPERETSYFIFFRDEYPGHNMIYCGDFNCPESNSVFGPLEKQGYKPALTGQKTTIKMEPKGNECLASEYDNFFYDDARLNMVKSGIIEFYKEFPSLKAARKVSDHVPVYLEFVMK